MSLFRKPTKKIQRRVFNALDEDDDADPEPPPPPNISRQKKENKPLKSTPLLSFADEEDDGEVFKVKKSSQSKRLAKKREKEKKTAVDCKSDFDFIEEQTEIITEQPTKPKKKVTLEGLILAGREALAADGAGDLSDSDPSPAPSPPQHQYRAETVRAALAAGSDPIPDAALIHAARKTRQQARELGGDYIPIRTESARPGARRRHDDDDDDEADDDDDDDEGRLLVRGLEMPSEKPKRDTEATEAEMDSEAEEWEEQQMQKAVPAINDFQDPTSYGPRPAPPPPRLDDAPPHLRPLTAVTVVELRTALATRLQELSANRDQELARRAELEERLLTARRIQESRSCKEKPLEVAYRRAQSVRAYITDLLECLDEKLPIIEDLERRALNLHKERHDFLYERKLVDLKDQAEDVMQLSARGGSRVPALPADSARARRAAEREGRRRARRLARGGGAHTVGDSSDDELPSQEELRGGAEREEIRRLSLSVFSDAGAAWRDVRGVTARTARVRRTAPALYRDAYFALALPKLLAPYVRHQLILWNPLADEDNEDFERMDWYKCLMMYGVRPERLSSDSDSESDEEKVVLTENSTREDPDIDLVPTIVDRVVLPKLIELVTSSWDASCMRATVRLRAACAACCVLAPRSPRLAELGVVVHRRLAAAQRDLLYLPMLPPDVWAGAGGPFWRRCVGAGGRLLRCALALCAPPPTLRADRLVLRLLGTMCTAAGAAPAAGAAEVALLLTRTLPAAGPLRAAALQVLARLAARASGQMSGQGGKVAEQMDAIIAEAKAYQDKSDFRLD